MRNWILKWLFKGADPRLESSVGADVVFLNRELNQVKEERDYFRDMLLKHVGLLKDTALTSSDGAPIRQAPIKSMESWPRLKARGEALEHQRAVDAKEKYWKEKNNASKVS